MTKTTLQLRILHVLTRTNRAQIKKVIRRLVEVVDVNILVLLVNETLPGVDITTKELRSRSTIRPPIQHDSYVMTGSHGIRKPEPADDIMAPDTNSASASDSDDTHDIKDKTDMGRTFGRNSLSRRKEGIVFGNHPLSEGLISGADPYPLVHPEWTKLGELYRRMHKTLEPVLVSWSASELFNRLPPILEAIRLGVSAKNTPKKGTSTLYHSAIHFKGQFGGTYACPGGPMECIWGLTACSGAHYWIKLPTNEHDIQQILKRIRAIKKKVDKTPNTELLYVVLESYTWDTLKRPMKFFLHKVADLCRELGVVVIADETFTGLGIMGDGAYFGFQDKEFGYIPDGVIVGKQTAVATLLLNRHPANPLLPQYDTLDMQMVLQNATTVFLDLLALQRATAVLGAILDDDKYLHNGSLITQSMPGLLEKYGLAVPTGGGGFVWKFELHAMPLDHTDGFARMRLPLDSTLKTVEGTLQLLKNKI
jgi:hypothetical protein